MSAMRKLSTVASVAIVAAVLSIGLSGLAMWRTNHAPKPAKAPPTTAAGLVAVPDVTNVNVYVVGNNLQAIALTYSITKSPSASVPRLNVISQDPAAGTQVPQGTNVKLTVSSGPP
jgi:serine/threonine-protein kinase